MEISDLTYEGAGVSIREQNRVNSQVKKLMRKQGFSAEGLFGGFVDISAFKKDDRICLDVAGSPLVPGENHVTSGWLTTDRAYHFADEIGMPVAALDYVALPKMGDIVLDFVTGVADRSLALGIPCIGGESAEMPDTYREGEMDAFVHVLSISGRGECDITDIVKGMDKPLLVASTDGTGTKTKIIRNPEDIIYHGFNDIATQGVRPIAFALYIAGNENESTMYSIDIKAQEISAMLGVTKLGSILTRNIDSYNSGEIDIAGTVIGVIDEKDLITGKGVGIDDALIGINVDGYMTNGCSMVRDFADMLIEKSIVKSLDESVEGLHGKSLLYEMSRPHRRMTDILFGYNNVEGVLSKFKGKIKGMAHITGGGQEDNIIRMVPDSCKAVVYKDRLPVPPLMQLMRKYGVQEKELESTFNMGVGFTLTVAQDSEKDVVQYINANFSKRIPGVDRRAEKIGVIQEREPKFQYIGSAHTL